MCSQQTSAGASCELAVALNKDVDGKLGRLVRSAAWKSGGRHGKEPTV